MQKHVAVIGAGIAGLACASALCAAGHCVSIFEKSRGPGGRMATRWLDRDCNPPLGFDHGAQYFLADNPAFVEVLAQAQKQGFAAPWTGQVVNLAYGQVNPHPSSTPRWVGRPGMASLLRYLFTQLPLAVVQSTQWESRIVGLVHDGQHHTLRIQRSDGQLKTIEGFDAVVCAIPAEQARDLMADYAPDLANQAARVQSSVTWSVIVAFDAPLKAEFDGAFVVDNPLGWICRDSSKPGRATGERWVLQATADWSRLHQENSPQAVAAMLLEVFGSVIGERIEPTLVAAHRWLYSSPLAPVGATCYMDKSLQLGACGDWMIGPRVQDAFVSGQALAEAFLKDWVPVQV
jgi:renalase